MFSYTSFNIYCMLNSRNELFSIPANRIIMALSYMRGAKVDNWAQDQMDGIITYLAGQGDPTLKSIWQQFKTNFKNAFTDTTEIQNAFKALQELKMGSDLDTYIATFEHLRKKAKWGRDDPGTLWAFRGGLNQGLHRSVLQFVRPPPATMDEWQRAA